MQFFDSLPYVDEIGEEDLKKASNMIDEEMKRFPPKDYLANHENIELKFDDSVFLHTEMEKIKNSNGKISENSHDFQRILKEPKENASIEEWEQSLKHAKSNFEHQHLRLINLELLNSYGKNSWLHYLSYLQNFKKELDNQLEEFKDRINNINRKRKIEQNKCNDVFNLQKQRLNEVVSNNTSVREACKKLEQSINEMENYLKSNKK